MYKLLFAACLLIGVANAQNGQQERNVCTGRRPGFFVQHLQLCNGYFFCHPDGRALFDICPAPLKFSEGGQECVFPDRAQCFQCPANEFRAQRPIDGTCDQYVLCINGIPNHRFCPSNLNFNRETNQCELNVQCDTSAPIPTCPPVSDPLNPIYFRDPLNCAKFQFCENGRLVDYKCPSGLHFNLEINQCDTIANAGCNGNGGGGDFQCPATSTGLPIYPHPSDCRRFFICANGVANPQECPPNTSFDVDLQNCVLQGTCVDGTTFKFPFM